MSNPKLTESEVASLCPEYSGICEIGYGGFKTVYRAEINGVTEVIKVIAIPDGNGTSDLENYRDECVLRVEREVDILRVCQSPYLVKLGALELRSHHVNGHDFVIYSEEFLDGDDLWKIIRRGGRRPDEVEAKWLMRCLIQAIEEIWSLKVIHRDIKPGNVIKLDDPDRPFVLLDLGIAFSLVETGLTFNAGFRPPPATFRYLAPEMGDPNFRSSLDYRADLYTAALTVFEYASGEHPIARDGEDAMLTVTRALRDLPKSLGAVCPGYSPDFVKLIDQLLKKKPALRPANLNRIINILES
jgi:eukaryotic-like serine/threonine-protein kinase